MTKITAYIDGLTEPRNPGGVAAYGVSITVDGEEIKAFKGVIGEGAGMSNNVAEYGALIALCKVLAGFGPTPYHEVQIKGDSQLVINQMRGTWRIKSGLYVKWASEAMSLLKELQVKYQWVVYLDWIPREQNTRADQLSREAYEAYCKENGMKAEYMADRVALQVERIAAADEMAKKDPNCAAWEAKNKEDFVKACKVAYENTSPTVMQSLKEPCCVPVNSTLPEKEPSRGEVKYIHSEPYLSGADGIPLTRSNLPSLLMMAAETYRNLPQSMGSCITPLKPLHAPPADTCENCKWLKWRGPHVGCFPNGKYRKWLSKSFIKAKKCDLHKNK